MKLYFAPMEGITTWTFRRIHHACFPGIDRYYTPFLTATQTESFKRKEIRDILPENNEGMTVIPQVLGNDSTWCLSALKRIASYGYEEINFNLGCSMPQVAKRGRGAGFLRDPEKLDRFFDELFEGLSADDAAKKIRLSVKTRIGVHDAAETAALLTVFNRYPFCELTVHPRLMSDLYRNTPDLDAFDLFCRECRHPLVYNGDILSPEQYESVRERFPHLDAVMMGRGLIKDPSLARQLRGEEAAGGREIETYMKQVWDGYLTYMASDRQVLPHMKEIWYYMAWHFDVEPGELKKLRKAGNRADFEAAQAELLAKWSSADLTKKP